MFKHLGCPVSSSTFRTPICKEISILCLSMLWVKRASSNCASGIVGGTGGKVPRSPRRNQGVKVHVCMCLREGAENAWYHYSRSVPDIHPKARAKCPPILLIVIAEGVVLVPYSLQAQSLQLNRYLYQETRDLAIDTKSRSGGPCDVDIVLGTYALLYSSPLPLSPSPLHLVYHTVERTVEWSRVKRQSLNPT